MISISPLRRKTLVLNESRPRVEVTVFGGDTIPASVGGRRIAFTAGAVFLSVYGIRLVQSWVGSGHLRQRCKPPFILQLTPLTIDHVGIECRLWRGTSADNGFPLMIAGLTALTAVNAAEQQFLDQAIRAVPTASREFHMAGFLSSIYPNARRG
jgi:hypothetical protein